MAGLVSFLASFLLPDFQPYSDFVAGYLAYVGYNKQLEVRAVQIFFLSLLALVGFLIIGTRFLKRAALSDSIGYCHEQRANPVFYNLGFGGLLGAGFVFGVSYWFVFPMLLALLILALLKVPAKLLIEAIAFALPAVVVFYFFGFEATLVPLGGVLGLQENAYLLAFFSILAIALVILRYRSRLLTLAWLLVQIVLPFICWETLSLQYASSNGELWSTLR